MNFKMIKLSDGKTGINLDRVTSWFMRGDGILLIGLCVNESALFIEGEDAQKMLQLLISLSIDLDEMLAKQNETPRNC